MSHGFHSPLNFKVKEYFEKINLSHFSSNEARKSINRKISDYLEKDSNSSRYNLENYIFENSNGSKITETKNRYNKFNKKCLLGKEKFTNFAIFTKREIIFKEKKSLNVKKKLLRYSSAKEKKPEQIYKQNTLYMTEAKGVCNHKKNKNMLYNPLEKK